jgi:hypothetical protein
LGTDFDTYQALFFSFDGKPGQDEIIGWKNIEFCSGNLLKQRKKKIKTL